MSTRRVLALVALAVALASSATSCAARDGPTEGATSQRYSATESSHARVPGELAPVVESVACDELLEASIRHVGRYDNKLLDVTLDATFTAPDGTEHRVKGFHYGGDVWRVRFRPDAVGRWTYAYSLSDKGGLRLQSEGEATCTPNPAEGPIRRSPTEPYRWMLRDGSPYFPVGLQDCVGPLDGGQLRTLPIDGEGRDDGSVRNVAVRDYFAVYGQAGFNLFRFSPNNCSFELFDNLERLREAESLATDELLRLARGHGFRVMFGFFGFGSSRHQRIDLPVVLNALQIVAQEKRYVEYCIARWGVYVDFWQLLNESDASNAWTSMMAEHVRSVDPDRKPISTSWEKPELPAIDINTPHWYESESELDSDLRVHQLADAWKRPGKPVFVGEHGNTGMNWDPLSATRMRVRSWTALFEEIGLIFWNTSWSKAGMHRGVYTPGATANIYLGPEERSYVRALRSFSARLDARLRKTSVTVSEPERVRAYALVSDTAAAVYLHHFEDHTTTFRGGQITLHLPGETGAPEQLVGEWIEPSTGSVLARVTAAPGRQTLEAPPFDVDLALLILPDRR